MRIKQWVMVFVFAVLGSVGLLAGCKSEAQVKAEQNIRTYISAEVQGMLKVAKIEYLGDEQNYDGLVWSSYRATLMPTDGRQLSTTLVFMTHPQTGEILDVRE